MSDNPIKYLTVLGERCSGTTYVEYAIKWNLGLENYVTCGKHFFGHDNIICIPKFNIAAFHAPVLNRGPFPFRLYDDNSVLSNIG